jgi:hypothetical protein
MTDQQRTKFTPGYRVQLAATILRCVEKESARTGDQLMSDARYVALQNLRKATDEAQRQAGQGAQP